MKARVVPDVIWRRPSFLFGSFVNFGIVFKSSYLLIVNILNIQRQTYLRRKFTEQNLLLQQIQHWITSIHVYKLDPSVSIIDGTKCLETVINPTAWCRETNVSDWFHNYSPTPSFHSFKAILISDKLEDTAIQGINLLTNV